MKNNKILKALGNIDIVIAEIAVAVLLILTLAGIIVRYIFNSPFAWLEEVTSACFLWSILTGSCVAFREKSHIAVEILVVMLPQKLQRVAEVIIMVITVLLLGYLTYQGILYVSTVASANRITSILRLPYAVIYGMLPVTAFWMLCNVLYAFGLDIQTWKREDTEGGNAQ